MCDNMYSTNNDNVHKTIPCGKSGKLVILQPLDNEKISVSKTIDKNNTILGFNLWTKNV